MGTVVDLRPPPPIDMDEGEAKVWRDVVAEMPPGWFEPQDYELLRRYCHHVRMMMREVKSVKLLASELKLGDWWTPELTRGVRRG